MTWHVVGLGLWLVSTSVWSTSLNLPKFGRHQCTSPYERYNASQERCDCKPGLSGWGCHLCSTEASCVQVNASTICQSGLEFYTDVSMKTYSCSLDSSLRSLLSDGQVGIECNQRTSNCSVAIYKQHEGIRGVHVIDCQLHQCHFTNASANANCEDIQCQCGPSCSSFTKSIVETSFSNKPVKIKVDGHHVVLDIEKAFIPISVWCNSSNCVEDPHGIPDPPNDHPSISVTMLLLLVSLSVLTLVSVCWCGRKLWQWSDHSSRSRYHNLGLQKKRDDHEHDTSISGSSSDIGQRFEFDRVYVKRHQQSAILHSVSGQVQKGRVLGILGPSGSGKSTLLNALAGVQVNSETRVSGSIKIDGERRKAGKFKRISAYVQQDDCLFSTLTVRECIEYSALLRLSAHLTEEAKQVRVDQVLDELNLEHIADCKIGQVGDSQRRGISGGERRRVSIGMELVTHPHILFLDEPTSGLDSHTANQLISLVKDLANRGRMVILSIHQPSAKAFGQLDDILCLAKGRVMYSGSVANVGSALRHLGFECPANENMAEFMLDVVSEVENHELLALAAATARKDIEKEEADDEDDVEIVCTQSDLERIPEIKIASTQNEPPTLQYEIQILFQRTGRNLIRHQSLFIMHTLLSLTLAIFGGAMFHHVTPDLAGFQNRSGAFYFMLTFFGFASCSSMDCFIQERVIFQRETRAGYYRVWPYYFSKVTLDTLVLRIFPALLFSSIFYFMMGLQSSTPEHFILFTLTLVLFNISAGAMCMCISICAPNVSVGNLVATVVLLIMLLFGGFLVNVQTMSKSISWLRHLSIFSYAFELLMTNELEGLLLKFDAPGYPSVPVMGDVFLKTLGMDVANQIWDLLALGIMTVGAQALAYLLLLLQAETGRPNLERKLTHLSSRELATI